MSGHPFSLDNGRARPTLLAVGEGVACLNMDIFALSLSVSLWETGRYRLKYCDTVSNGL